MIALFFGSRNWTDRERIAVDIADLPADAIVVSGGAPGADTLADVEAQKRGLHVATVRAQWERFGRAAGPRRNAAMLLLRPDIAYGYDLGGRGTADMARRLLEAGVPVVMVDGRAGGGER